MNMKSEYIYTQEQMDIALLKKDSEAMIESLSKIEKELISIDSKIESKIDSLTNGMNLDFRWTLVLFFGLYVSVASASVGLVVKAYHLFG